jgi:hypothetical protein
MSRRPQIPQTSPLPERPADAAARLRKEAWGVPAGVEREGILRRARLAERALRIDSRLSSNELQPPK